MAKLITDLKDNKTTSINPDILQNSINGFVADEKNRTIWINGMPYGNVYVNTDEGGRKVKGAEIFNDFETNTADGNFAHAEGTNNHADANYAHAEGNNTNALGVGSHTEGRKTQTSGDYSHAEGYQTNTTGVYSHAEGNTTNANGGSSHAEGYKTTSTGVFSHAEGNNTEAVGGSSHAEGYFTKSTGVYSHAEGNRTEAVGGSSHAEGYQTIARGNYSHVEGYETTSTGVYSHAEGNNTNANGGSSHAEGYYTIAQGKYSHAEGQYTTAISDNSHAEGQFNYADSNFIHSVGVGTAENNRKNAVSITYDGKVYVKDIGDYDGTETESAVSLADKLYDIDKGSLTIEKVTYNELKEQIRKSDLSPGKMYRITDYSTMTDPNNPNIHSAHFDFDILVMATSKNTLSEDAWACNRNEVNTAYPLSIFAETENGGTVQLTRNVQINNGTPYLSYNSGPKINIINSYSYSDISLKLLYDTDVQIKCIAVDDKLVLSDLSDSPDLSLDDKPKVENVFSFNTLSNADVEKNTIKFISNDTGVNTKFIINSNLETFICNNYFSWFAFTFDANKEEVKETHVDGINITIGGASKALYFKVNKSEDNKYSLDTKIGKNVSVSDGNKTVQFELFFYIKLYEGGSNSTYYLIIPLDKPADNNDGQRIIITDGFDEDALTINADATSTFVYYVDVYNENYRFINYTSNYIIEISKNIIFTPGLSPIKITGSTPNITVDNGLGMNSILFNTGFEGIPDINEHYYIIAPKLSNYMNSKKIDPNYSLTELTQDILAKYFDDGIKHWKLKYSVDNDKTLYDWCDNRNGKGVIYCMTDEYGNTAGYDFKNIIFSDENNIGSKFTFNGYNTAYAYHTDISNTTSSLHSIAIGSRGSSKCFNNIIDPIVNINTNRFYPNNIILDSTNYNSSTTNIGKVINNKFTNCKDMLISETGNIENNVYINNHNLSELFN